MRIHPEISASERLQPRQSPCSSSEQTLMQGDIGAVLPMTSIGGG